MSPPFIAVFGTVGCCALAILLLAAFLIARIIKRKPAVTTTTAPVTPTTATAVVVMPAPVTATAPTTMPAPATAVPATTRGGGCLGTIIGIFSLLAKILGTMLVLCGFGALTYWSASLFGYAVSNIYGKEITEVLIIPALVGGLIITLPMFIVNLRTSIGIVFNRPHLRKTEWKTRLLTFLLAVLGMTCFFLAINTLIIAY